eukprot:s1292_g3.t3
MELRYRSSQSSQLVLSLDCSPLLQISENACVTGIELPKNRSDEAYCRVRVSQESQVSGGWCKFSRKMGDIFNLNLSGTIENWDNHCWGHKKAKEKQEHIVESQFFLGTATIPGTCIAQLVAECDVQTGLDLIPGGANLDVVPLVDE